MRVRCKGRLWAAGAGRLIVGITAKYGTVAANVSSFYGNEWIRADGYSIGSAAFGSSGECRASDVRET